LEAVAIKAPVVPVVANVTAEATSNAETIRELLVQQVTGAVRWRESVLYMKAQGVEQLVECGAGNVLAGLTKRIDKELPALSLQTPEDIEGFLKTSK
jgi:[acyl-carrier-protein] S-malonyltransferase